MAEPAEAGTPNPGPPEGGTPSWRVIPDQRPAIPQARPERVRERRPWLPAALVTEPCKGGNAMRYRCADWIRLVLAASPRSTTIVKSRVLATI